MFVKIIASVVLLGFFSIQLVNSLECYSCDSLQSCKSPGKITCNAGNSNQTSTFLNQYFVQNVTNITSTSFNCLNLKLSGSYQSNNVTYKGCLYNRIGVCSLTPKSPYHIQKCSPCSSKLCNPAGTFSSSTMTVFASIIAVVLYKVLNV